MAKPRDHAVQLKRWLAAEDPFDIAPYLRTLPNDIDIPDAVRVMTAVFGSTAKFGTCCKKLPVRVIRGFLAQQLDDARHLFLRLVVDDDVTRIAATWAGGIQVLLDLEAYLWGSRQRRERLARIAGEPDVLQAIQGAVANSNSVSRDMLAVLVVDGGDASVDALVPHLDAALHGKDRRLERLTDLRAHARRTPVLDALFAEVDATLETRNAASPALALGPLIGLGHVEPLHFKAMLEAPGSRAFVSVDSRSTDWLFASASRGEQSSACHDAQAVPAWLARCEVDWRIEWGAPVVWHASVRGKKRDAIGRWLLSLSATTRR